MKFMSYGTASLDSQLHPVHDKPRAVRRLCRLSSETDPSNGKNNLKI